MGNYFMKDKKQIYNSMIKNIQDNDLEQFKVLHQQHKVDLNKEIVSEKHINMHSLLSIAVYHRLYNFIEYMLENEADINHENSHSCLFSAIINRDMKMVQLLCKYKVNPFIKLIDVDGELKTAYKMSIEKRYDEIVDYLRRYRDDY